MNISKVLESAPVVPLVQADDPAVAVNVSRALAAGGLSVVEVVLRTDRALECLRAVAGEGPQVIAGAGTVLSAAQAQQAIDNGIYGDWMPSEEERATLEAIFPDGVCDYSQPGLRP